MSVVLSLDVIPKKRISDTGSVDNGIYLNGTNGSTIVLIHGLTGTPNEMKFLATYFNKKGYAVICPRLARHGESIKILKNAKWREFYESVRRLFLDGTIPAGGGPVFTGGLSMGALLALLAADEFKDRVKAVTALAPTLFYDGWNTPGSKYLMPLAKTPLRYLYYFKEEPPYGIKNEAVQQRIHKYYSDAKLDDMGCVAQYGYPFFPVALLYQLQLIVKHLARKLPRMVFPVQLIQAKDDDMASVKNSKFIYDRIGSQDKEMIFLYDSYHVITADHERDIVAAKMEAFFARIMLPK